MNLITKDPFFGNLFDDFFEPKKQTQLMRSDIYEKDGQYTIEIDVPSFKKEEVKVDFDNGYLTISAVKEEEKKDENINYIKRERYYGEMARSYYIGDVKEKDIKAKFEEGTLKLTFPKEEIKEKTRLIPIE